MSFKVNIFANKWNLSFKERSIMSEIASTEFTNGKVKGDRVTVSAVTGITVQDYVQGTPISPDTISSTETVVVMDKQKLVAVTVEDLDEAQSNPKLLDGVVYEGTNAMVKQIDTDVIAQCVADATTNGNVITATGVTKSNVLTELLMPALTYLNAADAPDEGRYIVVPADIYSAILGADIDAADAGLGKQKAVYVMGMKILWSNSIAASTGLVGIKEATSFGASLSKVKDVDSTLQVGTELQILESYGSKVIKADGVAKVTFA